MAICERCGKEHDGTYGSGRFCCESCAQRRKNPGRQTLKEYTCPFCNRVWVTNKSGFTYHINRCLKNPNAIPTNKLTEETKQRIRDRAKQHPYHHSDAIKKKLSQIAKDLKLGGYVKGSGRGKKGWYNGFWCDSTYELAYLIYCLDHDINIKRNWDKFNYILNGKEYTYIPDFIVDNTYIEIKGYYNKLVDIKIACVNKSIKVLYGKDLTYVFDYIKEKYNKYKDKNIHELYNGIKDFGETNIGGVACS